MLGLRFCSYHVDILNNFEQETSHFHFTLGPTDYVASSEAQNRGLVAMSPAL